MITYVVVYLTGMMLVGWWFERETSADMETVALLALLWPIGAAIALAAMGAMLWPVDLSEDDDEHDRSQENEEET